ncbi:MAG: hypothetical protein A3I07_01255 [Candidatus Doudnabacteria bacterium RIFCSPLOWO2_02_FULL_42_9]|uniref:Uncharacterized protein n=1 Tax=Candidatus Doudnabacteria bacterium RIFCSPHIGHO2_01_FULL_41_86 TaxID=1817821 RepID=A0A1F5N8N8_9BACT|nr:MAG: hypothetical protein A2717_00820 [Candidatus Doudnabacteria bacterium RIFCSPHIGHO2_01_FULL_41_86]OGE75387.1 MAG: hypothetical protein A3K07_01335 [Candidatus Doudnabacteria bacterium RIFCSPHIGHO2_01_43_10]OGE86587.1 MAG: hypothetical protein A3E28_04235 [Candidatus Doudnabacteria bacterium RIFCSPHIGHO2_12_FULL_42_22]OGE87487.1 MAG: hypothetical protein A3C49_03895 [Candidatus Doudnabacteria bacterium RIFCSPHIGHO2_02_FULL_42_25]OGE92778.1 MAG: hypothetical protein A2895_04620 [Candidatus
MEREYGFRHESKEQSKLERKYFYHGTLLKDFEHINTEGFHFREGLATLSISPSFIERHWTKAETIMDQRKRSGRGKVHDLEPSESQGLILVIEPQNYEASHISSFPQETDDEVIFRNHWERHHHALHAPESEDLLKERLKSRKKPAKRDTLPPEQIKMALLSTPEFSLILKNFIQELRKGHIPLDQYVKILTGYLEKGEGIIKDEVSDKKELALEMINGEVEQYIVTTVRKLFLSIKHYQHKDVYTEKKGKKSSAKMFDLEQIESILASLKLLDLDHPTLKRYRDIAVHSLDQELAKLQ